jgi:VWFA-related protein
MGYLCVKFCLLLLLVGTSSLGLSQVMSIPSSGFGDLGIGPVGLGLISSQQMTNNLFGMQTNMRNLAFGTSPSSSISRLDLKAPAKARREYEKGYELLMRKDYQEAVEHLSKATVLYPDFVAAHNALGTSYLNLGQISDAEQEFRRAVALDDHLPNSHLNLGVAELALKNYSAAQSSLQKASSIAPLDTALKQALVYGEFLNKDYPAVIESARQLHKHKHEGTAAVHYFAAGAWDVQNNVPQAQHELEILLREAPTFPAAVQVRQLLKEMKSGESPAASAATTSPQAVRFSFSKPDQPTAEEASEQARKVLQEVRQKNEIAEAESAELARNSADAAPSNAAATGSATPSSELKISGGVLRARVDEVAVFFSATDHGKSVTNLTGADLGILDNKKPPAAILGFHNEAELPLRLGLIIDTSDSVSRRFSFEQKAAIDFLNKTLTGTNDLGFVVAVNNSVLLVQDFTSDHAQMQNAIFSLAPSGGTALWDAVQFGAEKLSDIEESRPVARVLVVISDGENNSSASSLREAIEQAQRAEVVVYTVSTRDYDTNDAAAAIGDHALKALSDLTGGAAFAPGSIRWLNGSLAQIEQVIRSRYMVSYKPAAFQRDGQYRPIEVKAEKDGHKLKVYARKGYYASTQSDRKKNE